MKYEGKLYANVGGRYIDTDKTGKDWDELEYRSKQLDIFLEKHEEFEAMIIEHPSFWVPYTQVDMHSSEIYNKFIELQSLRNQLKNKKP